MSHTEQLERETEQSRSELAGTIEELKASMTPGQVLDQLTDYASDGNAGAFYRNLRRQVGRNPIPATLIGAGVAWMMLANRNGGGNGHYGMETERRIGDGAEGLGESMSAGAQSAASALGESARRTGESARHAGESVGHAAGQAASSVMRTASSAYDAVTGGASRTMHAVGGSASGIGHRTASGSRSFLAFCREEPLVLAGIGIALGAAIGAALPSTETEDRLMGEKGDEARKALGDIAKPAAVEPPRDEQDPAEWSNPFGENDVEEMARSDDGSDDAEAAAERDGATGMPGLSGARKDGNPGDGARSRGTRQDARPHAPITAPVTDLS